MKTLSAATLIIALPISALAQDGPGAHFIENWDLNANGAVSLEEITERRGDIFYMFDADENELLSPDEYVLFDETRAADMAGNVESHGPGRGAGRMQEGLTLAFNDIDGDGNVAKAEFIAQSSAWFEMIDRNADGAVTSADFGPRDN